jgi:hypothetical protein
MSVYPATSADGRWRRIKRAFRDAQHLAAIDCRRSFPGFGRASAQQACSIVENKASINDRDHQLSAAMVVGDSALILRGRDQTTEVVFSTKNTFFPSPALVSGAGIAEAIIDTAVKADVWAPISCVPGINAVSPTLIARRP